MIVKRKRAPRSRSAYQERMPDQGSAANVIDIAEAKLRRIATHHSDADVRRLAARMLDGYLKGEISIAWDDGNLPVYAFLKA